MRDLNVVCCNFENNGFGDPVRRSKMYQLLAELEPHVLFRQEMWDAAENGSSIAYEMEQALGLRCWLGPGSCTALLADTKVFQPLQEWPHTGPMWVQPPTALTFRYTPAGPAAVPLLLVSYHLNYASSALRTVEAEWLTTWNDQKWPSGDGATVPLPAVFGGDNNSFPVRGCEGDPAVPAPEEISDRPHRIHRSRAAADGTRIMDACPDDILRGAGMEDVARHVADSKGQRSALRPTVDASPTHGPSVRIDRVYVSRVLLPAVASVESVDPAGLSDHHVLLVKLDGDVLTELLREAGTLRGRTAPRTA
ncbi:endonuclease/exonuclease/phosphatase family protein [Streptomyces ipomoeae]|uniref:endonuclease/exonuclease/phosphatase family protein n=1 Tax=Streptomyces ipomoeae TaxID=103232 RepID=UPI0011475289|nr:endonuclease/exonuclease/phosphatase family protein [Streptomyces ipomoeae]MDX2938372.1 endonuclease/exonuclease/phosphatase family protein [Streptomyces ipomoeae]TQE22074.1 endonuclease/exonuclease/phosphatase family protein [Streptomyces ipomoeae]